MKDVFVCVWLFCVMQPVGGALKPNSPEKDYYRGPDGLVGSSPMRTDLGLL